MNVWSAVWAAQNTACSCSIGALKLTPGSAGTTGTKAVVIWEVTLTCPTLRTKGNYSSFVKPKVEGKGWFIKSRGTSHWLPFYPVLSCPAYNMAVFSWWSLILADGFWADHFDADNFLDNFTPSPQAVCIVSSLAFTLCDPNFKAR